MGISRKDGRDDGRFGVKVVFSFWERVSVFEVVKSFRSRIRIGFEVRSIWVWV